jgi:hypothetical protein
MYLPPAPGDPSSSALFKATLTRLKTLFVATLQRCSWPPHSALQDVIDNWVEIAVNGGDGFLDSSPVPSSSLQHQQRPSRGGDTEGHVLLLTIFPHEILSLTAALCSASSPLDTGADPQIANWLRTFSVLSSDQSLSDCYPSPTPGTRSDPLSAVVLDTELLHVPSSPAFQLSLFRIPTLLAQAAVACYLALKYHSVSVTSAQTRFSCIFATDPRDLPLRGALIVFLLSALQEGAQRKTEQGGAGVETSPISGHKSCLFSECSQEFFSGFTRLVRVLSPELLVKERALSLTPSLLLSRLALSQGDGRSSETLETLSALVIQSLLSLHFSLSRWVRHIAPLSALDMTSLMTRVLRSLLPVLTPPFSGNSESSRSPLRRRLSEGDPRHSDRVLHDLWSLWRAVHSIHLLASQFELETLNLVLSLARCHHPHTIASYASLVREPLILFRLPLLCYLHPVTLRILLLIFRSVSVASRALCHETYRSNQSRAKLVLSQPLLPSAPSRGGPHHSAGEGVAHPSASVVTRDGSSRIENCDAVSESDFLSLQELLALRLLCELWTQICSTHSSPSGCGALSGSPSLAEAREWTRGRLSETLLPPFQSCAATILRESPSLLDSLLFYGLPEFPAFHLIASSAPAPTMSLLLLDKIQRSFANHSEASLSVAAKSMDLILLHLHHLTLCLLLQPSPPLSPHSSASASLELQLSAQRTVALFAAFLKRSLKFSCWKQQATANPTLGGQLLRCLRVLSVAFPLDTLRMIATCTSRDLFASAASSSPALLSLSSVLGAVQKDLFELRREIQTTLGEPLRQRSLSLPSPLESRSRREREAVETEPEPEKGEELERPKEKRVRVT